MTLATIATRIAGAAAMMENKPTMRTCSRAAARPVRRACTTCQTSRTITPSSSSTAAAFTKSSVTTTLWVGGIGVKSARTIKVTKAESSARPTAIGPSSRASPRFVGGATSAASALAACSALMDPCQRMARRLAAPEEWARRGIGPSPQ